MRGMRRRASSAASRCRGGSVVTGAPRVPFSAVLPGTGRCSMPPLSSRSGPVPVRTRPIVSQCPRRAVRHAGRDVDGGRRPGTRRRMKDHERERQDENATAAERAARRQREADRERAESEPFDYPYPERRANVRARRHISEAQAAADTPPGIPGGYGTTGGGQPGATGAGLPAVPRAPHHVGGNAGRGAGQRRRGAGQPLRAVTRRGDEGPRRVHRGRGRFTVSRWATAGRRCRRPPSAAGAAAPRPR